MRTDNRGGLTDDAIERDFKLLWVGQSASLVGSQVSVLAIPLTAALVLDSTPAQMGVLGAAQWLPFLLFGLPAGAWIDRRARRPLMIVADLGRAATLGAVPAAAALGVLTLPLLYVSAFATGVLQVVFELAYQSYVPVLVGRERLLRANGRLQASASAAQVGGPGLAGILTQAVSAPVAVLLDALSYLGSAASIAAIRAPERPPADRDGPRVPLRRSIAEGLRAVGGEPVLRAMAAEAGLFNLFETATLTLLVLFATRELGIGAGLLGAILALGAVGALAGAVVADRVQRRWPLGRAMVVAYVAACLPMLLLPTARGTAAAVAGVLVAAFAVSGFGVSMSQVYVWSVRQSMVAPGLLARMNAAYRFVVSGTVPLGALLGGILGSVFGLRGGIAVAAAGVVLAIVPILVSPIPSLRGLPPEPPGDDPTG
jgi:MFS family permease